MKNSHKALLLTVSTALLFTSTLAFSAGSFTAKPKPQKSTGYIVKIKYYIGRAHVGSGTIECNGNYVKEWGEETSTWQETKYACAPASKPRGPGGFKAN